MAGMKALENADVVYNKPKVTPPKLPTHHLHTRCLPRMGTAKFLYVLIPMELSDKKRRELPKNINAKEMLIKMIFRLFTPDNSLLLLSLFKTIDNCQKS